MLFDDDQSLPRAHGVAGFDAHGVDVPRPGRLQFILHLHGLYDQNALACFNGLARLDEKFDDLAWHGRLNRHGAVRGIA